MIRVEGLQVRYGSVMAVQGVSFSVARGALVTLLGPSGCGKTTTLRAIAGLEQPCGGSIALAGEAVYSAALRRNLPAEKRGVSMVFQSYAIWPHMDVFDNVAYGLRVRRKPRAEVVAAVRRALDLVQMGAYAARPASHLSGGQQQRVAVARAIAFSPEVVLFDEPLSNLDAKLRAEMRVELRDLQRQLGFTSLYVTHDQEEALAISDEVIVMSGGKIEQVGTPREMYDRPRNRFVAEFVGSANLISGTIAAGGAVFATSSGAALRVTAPGTVRGDETTVAVRASYVGLGGGAADNALPGRVRRRLFHGDFIEYVVDWAGGAMLVRRPPTEVVAEGAEVVMVFAAEHCVLLPN